MGALTIFFFLKETTLIAPSPIFSKHWALSPTAAPLWTPNPKIKRNVFPYGPPFHFLYIGVELSANHMG
jgi:hypothetical protein